MRFDRIFNKVEKFDARAMTDPVNHERRERRMLDRKRERWVSNYTYFFGDLTEEEQQYRDYFQTELERDPEDDFIDEKMDEIRLAQTGQFDPSLYDFIDYTQEHDAHENYDDIVEQKLFKFKYRMNATDLNTFQRRQMRVRERFIERAKTRDPLLEQDLMELFASNARDSSVGSYVMDPSNFRNVAEEETRPFREYMLKESLQQYKDFYESDDEEQSFFEYMDNLTNRDKIRFMEIFQDYTVDNADNKEFIMIQKREYNPELSILGNMVLDLVDFKDRVRPLSKDIAMLEQAQKYQKQNAEEQLYEQAQFEALMSDIRSGTDPIDALKKQVEQPIEEGYSSIEVPEKQSGAEDTQVTSEPDDAAEPQFEQQEDQKDK